MIQECLEDQGNLVQEIGRPGEVQEVPGRSVKSREVQKCFGGQVNLDMLLVSGGYWGIQWGPGEFNSCLCMIRAGLKSLIVCIKRIYEIIKFKKWNLLS